MRKAIVDSVTGEVLNVIEWVPEDPNDPKTRWSPPAGTTLEDAEAPDKSQAEPGGKRVAGKFERRPIPAPTQEQLDAARRQEIKRILKQDNPNAAQRRLLLDELTELT